MFRAILVSLILLMLCLEPPVVLAQPAIDDVEALTYKIIKLQADAERYSLNYRLVSTNESTFKALRYFAGVAKPRCTCVHLSVGCTGIEI